MKKVPIRILTSCAVVIATCLIGIPAAQAQSNICGNDGSGYCMNAWNGGPTVKMYYGGVYNDNFSYNPVFLCSGSDRVQSTLHGSKTDCPFTNKYIDSDAYNAEIVEIVYDNATNECVASETPGYGGDAAVLGACGNMYGTGAANGVFDVVAYDITGQCFGNFLVNRFWTNFFGSTETFVESDGNPGADLETGWTPQYTGEEPTCWG